jgi:hypothetical protein
MHPNFRVTSKVTVDLKNIDKSDCHFEKQKTTEPMDYLVFQGAPWHLAPTVEKTFSK